MIPVNPVDFPPLQFDKDNLSQKVRMSSNKIGWFHSLSDKPDTKFDITIKDSLGRVKLQKQNCGGGKSLEYGEFIGLPAQLGEELEISLDNVRGGDKIRVFIN